MNQAQARELNQDLRRQKRGCPPHWNDREALHQMFEFLIDFPQGSRAYHAAAWCQGYDRRGQLPPPDLRAKLIKTALTAGWKPGIRSVHDLGQIPDTYWA